jgi:hypothetical protein
MGKTYKERVSSLYGFYRDLRKLSVNFGAVQAVDLIIGENAGADELVAWLANPVRIQKAVKDNEAKLNDRHIRIQAQDPTLEITKVILRRLDRHFPNVYKLAERAVEAQDALGQQEVRQDH